MPKAAPRRDLLFFITFSTLLLVMFPPMAHGDPASPSDPGLTIYQAQCASCHGVEGQGADDGTGKLSGDKTLSQLTQLIQETMPEDDPGSLSADDAAAVAAYVHHRFYSAIAQARTRPPRIELARLTVHQHRQVLADLVGSFRQPVVRRGEPGLTAWYFEGRHLRGNDQSVAKRVDPVIDFNFGTTAPVEGITDPRNYSIRWVGAIIPPETGSYEIAIDTAHAARLWLNDAKTPAVDYWVRSGDDSDLRARVFLLGGRPYPVRIEFSRGTQGVSDENVQKKNLKEEEIVVRLLWRRPGGVLEPIASRFLASESVPETYITTVAFPPDDRSYGWERGTTISREWDEATTEAALATADYVADHLDEFARAGQTQRRRQRKLREFATRWVELTLRQPLDEATRHQMVDVHFEGTDDPEVAVRRVLLLSQKSPRFLFRELGTAPEAYDTAARMAFTLWDSLPDQALLDAARDGKLTTDDEIRAQAQRMLDDPRATYKLMRFLLTWLQVDNTKDLGKDPKRYPGFDEQVIADLRTSLELHLNDVLDSERTDFRELLLTREIYLNRRLAEFYGAEPTTEEGFTKYTIDSGHRAGVVTHPFVMTHFANNTESSPIHRGVFLARTVLGQALKPPPEAVAPLSPDLHPDLTTRERVALQTQPSSCMTCHAMINPLGFTLERFDAVGKFRDQDQNKPVDDSGEYVTLRGETVPLQGARPLAEFLVSSDEAHRALVENAFHFMVQQSAAPYGADTIDTLRQKWVAADFNLKQLVVEIVVATARVARDTQGALPASTPAASEDSPPSPPEQPNE